MKAYLHKNWCGLGDRIVVHPLGLPPGWEESNLSTEGQGRALDKTRQLAAVGKARITRLDNIRPAQVIHLDPKNLEWIESFNLLTF